MLSWPIRHRIRPAPDAPLDADAHGALTAEQAIELKKRAILEVAARTKAGYFAYPLLWLLAMQGGPLPAELRGFVLLHAAGLAVVGFMRLGWSLGLAQRLDRHFALVRLGFRAVTLLHGIYWGALLTACIVWPELASTHRLVIPITIVLVITGSMMMAIDRVLGPSYPLVLLAPAVVAVLALADPIGMAYTVGVVSLTVYGWMMSRLLRSDWLRGERARFLLENRARDLEALSMTDGLTGVRNSLFIDRHLPSFWKEARRQRQPLSVALVDLDHFKRINDSHGHAFGDECLRHAAQALSQELLRPTDVVARYGGEEFLLVLPNTTADGAHAVAQRMRQRLRSRSVPLDGQQVVVTCSIGLCTTVPDDDEDGAQQLIKRADEALYRAKAAGRDRVAAHLPAARYREQLQGQ